jgi:hypothetical protein
MATVSAPCGITAPVKMRAALPFESEGGRGMAGGHAGGDRQASACHIVGVGEGIAVDSGVVVAGTGRGAVTGWAAMRPAPRPQARFRHRPRAKPVADERSASSWRIRSLSVRKQSSISLGRMSMGCQACSRWHGGGAAQSEMLLDEVGDTGNVVQIEDGTAMARRFRGRRRWRRCWDRRAPAERPCALAAPAFDLGMVLALVALDDDDVGRPEARDHLAHRRLVLVAQLVHQRPAPAGDDGDLAGAGLAVTEGIGAPAGRCRRRDGHA